MSDRFRNHASGLSGPVSEVYDVTPNDGTDLAVFTRALSVAVSGLVRVTTVSGTTASVYILAGAPFPVRVRRVWATGTEATGIVGLV